MGSIWKQCFAKEKEKERERERYGGRRVQTGHASQGGLRHVQVHAQHPPPRAQRTGHHVRRSGSYGCRLLRRQEDERGKKVYFSSTLCTPSCVLWSLIYHRQCYLQSSEERETERQTNTPASAASRRGQKVRRVGG